MNPPTPPEPVRSIRQAADAVDPFRLYSLEEVQELGIPAKYAKKLVHPLTMLAPGLDGYKPPDFGIPGWQVLYALAIAVGGFGPTGLNYMTLEAEGGRDGLEDDDGQEEARVGDVDPRRAVRVLSGLCRGAILRKTLIMWKRIERQK
jgi:hypothetical protein